MASAQVVETSVNTNNSPSQDYTTNPDDHSNHNKNFNIIQCLQPEALLHSFFILIFFLYSRKNIVSTPNSQSHP